MPPIGLFIFAWSARSDVHWIGCLIGTAIYTGANFITLQCLFFYVRFDTLQRMFSERALQIILTYPQYSASLLAFNDFMRSAGAAGVLHAGGPMFRSMHIDGGVSFLAGLTILGIPG